MDRTYLNTSFDGQWQKAFIIRAARVPDNSSKTRPKGRSRLKFFSRHRDEPSEDKGQKNPLGYCQICHKILSGGQEPLETDVPYRYFDYHKTIPDIQDSVSQGCYVCTVFWDQFNTSEKRVLIEYKPELRTSFRVANYTDIDVHLTAACEDLVIKNHASFLGRLYEVEYIDPTKANSTHSPEAWQAAQAWIGRCIKSHTICQSMRSKIRWYPSRLVDVGGVPSNMVRVIQTADTWIDQPYVTLSHCWGKAKFLQLTDSNLQQLLEGIDITKLSKTFQDTIETTRRLGMRYVWIDSLCIIQQQESKEDWLHEAPLMGTVYSNSYCNIAATAATDSTKGLFHDRDPHCVFPQALSNPITQSEVYLTCFKQWETDIQSAPLMQRGWVVQERTLAPRVLHFGRQQLYWECCEGQACERFPEKLPMNTYVSRVYAGVKRSLVPTLDQAMAHWRFANDSRKIELVSKHQPVYELWNRIVAAYTRTELTFPGDKLIAIAGPAKKIQSILGVDYLAGLWNDNLAIQLLWQVRSSYRKKRPVQYRAPSFSWASVDGAILPSDLFNLPTDQYIILIEIVDVNTNIRDTSIVKQVRWGYVSVKGELRAFGADQTYEEDADMSKDDGGPDRSIRMFLPVITRRDHSQQYWVGLVLQPVNIEKSEFRRVGMKKLVEREWERLAGFNPGEEPAREHYHDGTWGHVIRII